MINYEDRTCREALEIGDHLIKYYLECNMLLQQICSWSLLPHIYNQFDSMKQNPGAKILLCNNFFCMKLLVQMRELCSGSMLQERVAGASFLVCLYTQPYAFQKLTQSKRLSRTQSDRFPLHCILLSELN